MTRNRNQSAAAPATMEAWTLTLSSALVPRRHVVLVNETPVHLRPAQFRALATLVRCRIQRDSGYAQLRDFDVAGDKPRLHQWIRRLRNDFDQALGVGAGHILIEELGYSTYRLTIPRDRIEVHPNICELVPEYLSETVVDQLLANPSLSASGQ